MFSDNDAFIIGLTGMSGAGKTTACEAFREAGFGIINCDAVSRTVVEKGRPALVELCEYFGKEILLSDGSLDRKKLGRMIFSDSKARFSFNEIIYPYISYEMIKSAVKYIDEGYRFILLDAPTLFESGTDSFCDIIVSVVADKPVCVERIMARDNLTCEEAEDRLCSQFPPEFYRDRSDFCVENKSSPDELRNQIRKIALKIGVADG